ncbi:MAG TPA: ATP-dependent helicase HrpB [Spirochaetales bacterium]|nr:ATP-dependent helicase HrpB [Spirochaetales bacterium]HRY55253.1 ATP-dependent helicase HrpB [Spirochaetia bacterium]HRZ64202.1 ATP-dependent helicase HrpB [Spirochaetia bacterium]
MLGPEAAALPLFPLLPDIAALLRERGSLVLSAEPGAGKTSLVPPYLALEGGIEGRILLLEPRRAAAAGAAARIAELLGEAVGRRAGYRVRGDSRAGPATRVLAMTGGVLVRTIQADPGLAGVGCVILDEFHERSAEADLCLALLGEARALRPELRLLVMSATMDVARIASFLGAPALEAPGRCHPVETRHAAAAPGRGFEERLAALAPALAEESGGDVLVFLPGAAEIARAAAALAGSGLEVQALHGSMPLAEQRRVISPPGGDAAPPGARRRAILATSVAETSLTVPRVRAVIDSGLARLTRFHARSGLNRLVTERESADRADQRRGRAGRLGPGICLRAWPAGEGLALRTEPELLRAELSSLVLESALWGARGRTELPWLDPPPAAAWEAARELLGSLGALDARGAPTEAGRRMAGLGTEPRLAALVLRGAAAGEGRLACELAALLSDRGGSASGERDLAARLEELERAPGRDPAAARIREEASRLEAALGPAGRGPGRRPGDAEKPGLGSGPAGPAALGPLLAAAFPDRIGARTEYAGPSASFRLVSGRALSVQGPLAQASWIVAAEADAGEAAGRLYSGAALRETEALAALAPRIEEAEELEWKGLSYRARRIRRAGAIVLAETALGALGREAVAASFCARLAIEGLGILPWGEGPSSPAAFLARLRFWLAARGSPGSAAGLEPGTLEDRALAARAAAWLGPFVGAGPGPVLEAGSLRAALEAMLDRPTRLALDREAPGRIALPSGSERPVDYAGPEPALEARVQELFGLDEQPAACGRPLVLRLLTPAGRPLQVTADLPGFWRGSWAEARKELRGRYPKHEWPERPWEASPSRSGIRGRK